MRIKAIICVTILSVLVTSVTGCRTASSDKNIKDATYQTFAPSESNAYDLKGRTVKIGTFEPGQIPKDDVFIFRTKRNDVETKYNCKIEWVDLSEGISSDDLLNKREQLYEQVFSSQRVPDIINININCNYVYMINKGYIIPIDDYVDFNIEPYNHPIQNSSLWKGKHYGVVSSFDGAFTVSGLYYNTSIFKRMGFPDAFELQQKGQWTWDTFLEIVKAATCDINGDGTIDQWGFGTFDSKFHLLKNLSYSNGAPYIQNVDGKYELALGEQRATDALEFLKDLYNTHKVVKELDYQVSDEINCAIVTSSTKNTIYISECVLWPKGPKADNYMPVAGPSSFFAVTSATEDAEIIANILKDYIIPNSSNYSKKDLESGILSSTVPVGLKKTQITQIKGGLLAQIDYFSRYQPLTTLLTESVDNIIDNRLPAISIIEVIDQAQKLIDEYVEAGS